MWSVTYMPGEAGSGRKLSSDSQTKQRSRLPALVP